MELTNDLTRAHFAQMAELERRYYDSAFITPPEEAYAWYARYPYTAIAAVDNGAVAGFINLFPVAERVMEQLASGLFNDRDLTADDIVDIHASQTSPLHMFLSCIVVAEAYRAQNTAHALLMAAIGQYAPVAHRCGRIVTDNVTDAGERFSRKYGFAPACPSHHNLRVYIQNYQSFCERVRARVAG